MLFDQKRTKEGKKNKKMAGEEKFRSVSNMFKNKKIIISMFSLLQQQLTSSIDLQYNYYYLILNSKSPKWLIGNFIDECKSTQNTLRRKTEPGGR
jgi:hypothetical protein